MKLSSLKPLLDHDGPLTTVCLDITPADEAGDRDVRGRWSGLRRSLEQQGAPAATLDMLGEALLAPNHAPGLRGRFVIASGTQILFDRVLTDAPTQEEAIHDGMPAMLPAARAADEAVRYLLVVIDRSGADLYWSGDDTADTTTDHVEGGHDELRKVKGGGGWRHDHMQNRAEDSWERNAEAVAAELDRAVVEHKAELVLVSGDVRAVAYLQGAVGKPVRDILVEVPGGARAAGVKEEVFASHVEGVLLTFRAQRREATLDRLREGLGRGDTAVTELGDVIEVLRRGQVEELVVVEDAAGVPAGPLQDRTLWVGANPLELGLRRSELDALGVPADAAHEQRADIALVRAAVAQDAGITFAVEGSVDLVDGIGALLRWTDAATPHETAPSYTGDSRHQGR